MKPDIEPKVLEEFLDVLADLFCEIKAGQEIHPKRLRTFAKANAPAENNIGCPTLF